MNEATKKMVRGWLEMHHRDIEALARWMRDSLHSGGIRACRALIAEAIQ